MKDDMLDQIVAHKRRELQSLPKISLADVKPSSRDLCHFIATQRQEVAVIAEIKKATPFRGQILKKDINVATWAQGYEDAGAAAISVLTDEHFFQGSLADLEAVSRQVALPVLRKDFILDARQIYQARLYGADAILLIVCCLTDAELREFLDICLHIHMRALVEVHDRTEVERALAVGARLLGINNRNLEDGSVDLRRTEDLVRLIPRELIVVAESGIEKPQDVHRLKGLVDAVLVGTALMTHPQPPELLKTLVAAGENAP
jgi:indole-3-glycerol phosphate synthase